MTQLASEDEIAGSGAEAADRRQAQYFLGMLSWSCVEVDRRIAKYEAAMASYEARGRVDDSRRCRRLVRAEERDRQELEWMIAALQRRFP